jgi:hypothetical protein
MVRSAARRRISNHEANAHHNNLILRDAAIAGVACANLAMERLLTMGEYP